MVIFIDKFYLIIICGFIYSFWLLIKWEKELEYFGKIFLYRRRNNSIGYLVF